MTIEIQIECETIGQLSQHLAALSIDILKQRKRLSLSMEDAFPDDTQLDDSNCYGSHELTVKNSE